MGVFKIFRGNEWVISKLLFNLSLFTVGLMYYIPVKYNILLHSGFIIIYIFSVGALGYFINDNFDVNEDLKAGRNNRVAGLSFVKRISIFFVLVLISCLPFIFYFDHYSVYLLLVLLQLLLFVLYSMPPFRLKRGFAGLISDSLFSFVIPGLISFMLASGFEYKNIYQHIPLVLGVLWLFLIGLRGIVLHQYKDFSDDLHCGSVTFAIRVGKQTVYRLGIIIGALELMVFIMILFCLEDHLNVFIITGSFLLFLLLEYFVNKNINLRKNWLLGISVALNIFYNYYLAISVGIIAAIDLHWGFIILPAVIFIWRIKNRVISVFKNFYYTVLLFFYYKLTALVKKIF